MKFLESALVEEFEFYYFVSFYYEMLVESALRYLESTHIWGQLMKLLELAQDTMRSTQSSFELAWILVLQNNALCRHSESSIKSALEVVGST